MKYLQNRQLEIIVFACGAVVMVLEIIGSRVFAPYLGTSIYIWTSLIGIIMGSLSIGYYLGGKLADRNTSYKTLSGIIFFAGCFIVVTNLIKHLVLTASLQITPDPKISSLFTGILLFVAPNILLGMVSPYAVKLRLNSLNNSASTVGNLYAISTIGSIVGTFIAGFYLISYFGTTKVIYILSLFLIILSIFTYLKDKLTIKIVLFLVCFWLFLQGKDILLSGINNFIDVDTKYNRVWIFDSVDAETHRPIRTMMLSSQDASAMFLDGNDLVFEYTKYFNLISFF